MSGVDRLRSVAKRRKLVPWILGSAPVACGLGVLGAAVPGEYLLMALTGMVVYGSALGAVGWAGTRLTRIPRLKKALAGGYHGKALHMLQKWRKDDALVETLRTKVPFPGDAVRDRMVNVVRELLTLRKVAADPSNPHIPAELRKEIDLRSTDLLRSLWPKCQDLSLLARPGMEATEVEAKVARILVPLEDLAAMIATTRQRLIRSTLEGATFEIDDALENAGAMKWQVTEAPRINAMLEG